MMSKLHFILLLAAAAPAFAGHAQVSTCTLKNNKQGFCVQSYLCLAGRINENGDDLLDERTIECQSPKVCCELNEKITATTSKPLHSTLVPGVQKPPKGPGSPCTAYDESAGFCLYPHLCRNDSTATSGDDLLDERTVDPCPNWRGALQICCPTSLLPPDIDIDGPTTETPKSRDAVGVKCETKFSEQGKCVPFYQCTANTDDGADSIDVRNGQNTTCPYTKMCCPLASVDETRKPDTLEPSKGCGRHNEGGLVYKIFNGRTNEAKFGEFPWMIAVRTRRAAGPDYNTTGGSLIHPYIVLTAAHYVVRAAYGDVRVRAGEWDIQSTEEPLEYQERRVKKTLAHPEFVNKNKHNDIALLFLELPFVLTPHVGVVCLPPAIRVPPSTDCVSNGWGKDKFGNEGRTKNILKKTILPAVDHDSCETSLRQTRLGPFFRLHEGFMCAGGERLDTCTQDGGGPLACTLANDSRFRVWGIVSWGIGCGQDGLPGVYVDVSQYRSWILDKTLAEGYDVDEYEK